LVDSEAAGDRHGFAGVEVVKDRYGFFHGDEGAEVGDEVSVVGGEPFVQSFGGLRSEDDAIKITLGGAFRPEDGFGGEGEERFAGARRSSFYLDDDSHC
jgi:hypothetical protein